jgi:hypothetical protein
MGAEPVFVEINSRLRRAVRNGTRLHLDPEHARALMQPRFYALLAEAEAQEITSLCASANDSGPPAPQPRPSPPANDSRSDNIGSGIGPTETTGTSAGSKVVQLAAEEQVSEAVEAIRLWNRRRRP